MPEPQHVGYAARTAERFRFTADPNEVMLRISREAAEDILWAHKYVSSRLDGTGPGLDAVAKALESMGIEGE